MKLPFFRRMLFLLALQVPLCASAQKTVLYEVKTGSIDFNSNAPQELIHASSSKLRGILDVSKKTFAFKIPIASFRGFNSPLQQEHFNENYMESDVFPEATYTGKIIEDIDFSKDGKYQVRTKGRLRIHGIEQERIIRSDISIKGQRITVFSAFMVSLADHNIKIPRVVYDKLAPDINVTVQASFIAR